MASPSSMVAKGTGEWQRGYRKKAVSYGPPLLKLPWAWKSPGDLVDSAGVGWGPRFYFSSVVPMLLVHGPHLEEDNGGFLSGVVFQSLPFD